MTIDYKEKERERGRGASTVLGVQGRIAITAGGFGRWRRGIPFLFMGGLLQGDNGEGIWTFASRIPISMLGHLSPPQDTKRTLPRVFDR